MEATPYQHYRFGPARLASRLPLPVLPTEAHDGGPAELVLDARPVRNQPAQVTAWRHHWPARDGSITLSLAAEGDGYRLRFPGLCDFLIDNDADALVAEPMASVDPHTLEHLVVDQLLPRVLAHRGALVAHASVVRVQDRAIAFLGHSGWGKSTLAGLLHGAGHSLLSDDCALLQPTAGRITVVPTYPSLRMFGDSISQTLGHATATTPVAAYSPKQRLMVTLAPAQAGGAHCPLQAIYLLNDPAEPASDHRITLLAPALACMALVEHSFRLDLASTTHTTDLLRQAAGVLRQVPAFALHYPRDYAGNAGLRQTVLAHLAGLGSTHPGPA